MIKKQFIINFWLILFILISCTVDRSKSVEQLKNRAAVEACNEFEKNLTKDSRTLIKDGTQVSLGEYPHSAALGFPIRQSQKFDFYCGGSLIDERFVLTSAHCVIARGFLPTIVRLGFVDFNDKNRTLDALQIPIQKIHMHPNYTLNQVYNDIALVELERKVNFSWKIRPICLYIHPEDPPSQYDFYATGWGGPYSGSKDLLKAQGTLGTVEQCNSVYSRLSHYHHGLDSSQMCAYGMYSVACKLDLGGPLNMVMDKALLKYRLVGIVSHVVYCRDSIILYTRVSAYLDYIESIVWPTKDSSTAETITSQPPIYSEPVITRSVERAAVEACNEFDKNLTLESRTLIKGGTKVFLGEYPHSAALGYPITGTNKFEFLCGGSLIDERFVLTAAHCVIRPDATPAIVRLGFVDFNDKNQTLDAFQIPIEKIYIHPDYRDGLAYNDISILELERNVNFFWRIRPICLYTQPEDPPPQYDLYVTGWGSTSNVRSVSSVLLKAQVKLRSVEQCNSAYGSLRQLPHGLDSTQMCTYDADNTRTACQGDSGGPLNLVMDNDFLKYRLVGIISVGFSCSNISTTFYTRVSAHLDFIEGIVWPRTDARSNWS